MDTKPVNFKKYLGDGAYVDYDGHHLVLTTENGIRETNRICLEPQVLKALNEYASTIEERYHGPG